MSHEGKDVSWRVGDKEFEFDPIFSQESEVHGAATTRFPEDQILPPTAYQIVHDEIMLDGNARLNLATFVGTWMGDYADRLYAESFDKNMIDKDEYPATAAIEERCWRMLADLWNTDPDGAIGTSAIGSSEACMLGGLALKRRWQQARRAAGKDASKPNLVMSSAVQVVWEKFCNYWDIEPRYVPVTDDHPCLDGTNLADYIDENTIGLVAIMGVTYTGVYEPVKQIAGALDEIEKETGFDIPIHVDGASGGMIAPFLQPDIEWDFRVPRVHSISTSGHKYGLVYPGVGWVVWAKEEYLPEDLIFKVSYLGGEMPTLALNFSRPGAQVVLQYFTFLRMGKDGYRRVHQACQDVAKLIAEAVGAMDDFEVIADGSDIPVVAWRLIPGKQRYWTLFDLSDRLRAKGWQVPSYPLPDDMSDRTVQRVVVRNGLGQELAKELIKDIEAEVAALDSLTGPLPFPAKSGYRH